MFIDSSCRRIEERSEWYGRIQLYKITTPYVAFLDRIHSFFFKSEWIDPTEGLFLMCLGRSTHCVAFTMISWWLAAKAFTASCINTTVSYKGIDPFFPGAKKGWIVDQRIRPRLVRAIFGCHAKLSWKLLLARKACTVHNTNALICLLLDCLAYYRQNDTYESLQPDDK